MCKILIIHLLPSCLTLTILDTIVDVGIKTYDLLPMCIMVNDQCIQLLSSHRYTWFDHMASPLLVLTVGGSF